MIVDPVIDYGVQHYNYQAFSTESRHMTTLPLPLNDSGSEAYKKTIDILKGVNKDESLSSNQNQAVVQKAIVFVKAACDKESKNRQSPRIQTLLALLYFIHNDYSRAKASAKKAERLAQQEGIESPISSFIYGTSLLYSEKVDIDEAVKKLEYSIKTEPDNPLSPHLFAIFLDRLMYRLNDGSVAIDSLDKVYAISDSLDTDKRKAIIQIGALNRYFVRLLHEGTLIRVLTGTENEIIRYSPRTLADAETALRDYKILLAKAKTLIDKQEHTIKELPESLWNKAIKSVQDSWDEKWLDDVRSKRELWKKYSSELPDLEIRAQALSCFQSRHNNNTSPIADSSSSRSTPSLPSWYWILVPLALYALYRVFYSPR